MLQALAPLTKDKIHGSNMIKMGSPKNPRKMATRLRGLAVRPCLTHPFYDCSASTVLLSCYRHRMIKNSENEIWLIDIAGGANAKKHQMALVRSKVVPPPLLMLLRRCSPPSEAGSGGRTSLPWELRGETSREASLLDLGHSTNLASFF